MDEAVSAAWPLVGRTDELDRALASLDDARGVVLSGAPGVGKSRLAAELTAAAEADGWSTVSVAAGPETAAVGFSPFAPLLDADRDDDLMARFLRAGRALERRARHVLVVVDDGHLLDDVSVAFVRHLLTATEVRVVITLRSGVEVPSTLVTLWHGGLLRRLEVLALAEDETIQLVRLALPGRVHQAVLQWVWQTTRGNPLFVHELVLDAVERGQLQRRSGRWGLTSEAKGAGSRLREVVAARVGALDPEERVAVELVALGEPLGLDLLEQLSGASVVASLDQRGLLDIRPDRRRSPVRLAHPLHGEVVRATIGATALRARHRELIDATEAAGHRRHDDAIRLALWRCAIGDVAEWQPLLAAAERLAGSVDRALVRTLDAGQAGRVPSYGYLQRAVVLAQGAFDGGGGVLAATLLVRLLSLLGREAEADAIHAEAVRLAEDDADELALLRVRARATPDAGRDAAAARERLRAFAGRTADPDLRASALALLALMASLVGAPEEAQELARPLLESGDGSAVDRLTGLAAVAASLGGTGRMAEGMALVEAAVAAAADVAGEDTAGILTWLSMVQCQLLSCSGRIAEAEALSRSCYEVAARAADSPGMGLFAVVAAHIALDRGHPAAVLALTEEAIERLTDVDPFGVRRLAAAMQLHALVLLGRLDDAASVLASLGEPAPLSQEHRARAWFEVASGGAAVGAARLSASAETQAQAGQTIREAAALHDLVRLGNAAVAAERLRALAASSDSDAVATMAAQAVAVAEGDADRLVAVAERWCSLHFDLFGAEAFAQAAQLLERSGRTADAMRARVRKDAALAPCGDVATPALLNGGPLVALTPREREVAVLAARGFTNRQISEALVVSQRTVDSHLYNAYTKLGLSGREELAGLLGLEGA